MYKSCDLSWLPGCTSERTPPAPSRTPHNLQPAALQRTWPPETQTTHLNHYISIWPITLTTAITGWCLLETTTGFIHYSIYMRFCFHGNDLTGDEMNTVWRTGGWTIIKGFLVSEIRGQIDFISVSNAVYCTCEVATYCFAYEAAHAQQQHHHRASVIRVTAWRLTQLEVCLVSKQRV